MSDNGTNIFGPYELLNCYANGIFPMSDGPDAKDMYLVDPEKRGVFPLNGLKISKSLAKTVRSNRFEIRINSDFTQTIQICGAPERAGAWINSSIIDLYTNLHDIGHAHSVECWYNSEMVGGLYGVSLRGAFFGESMFSHMSNASKTALVHLVGRLNAGGFSLLDAQFITPHLKSLGAVEISREDYHQQLENALTHEGNFLPSTYRDGGFSKTVKPSSGSGSGGGGGMRQSKTQIS